MTELSLLEGIRQKIRNYFQISDSEFEDIFDRAKETHIKKGSILYKEGKRYSEVYIIAKGSADIIKFNRCINTVIRGDVLGEMSLVGPKESSATVIASTDMIVYKFNKDYFDILLNRYPQINKAIVMESLSRKLQQREAEK
ncbi:MAG: hypothetical protein A2Y40_03265 [Candidatus Margulisbacteria bacterium GWF2_35_9]|nr:MAG: hypothetical protein A2Y40_03265 [Candidatus Margulisbacteria bacterium GWF2_35_9]